MSRIKIDHISRYFGKSIALDQVNLEVQEGEFFSLLGPSGCGKSTLLNIIAGFLESSSGVVYIGGKDVTNLPPYQRNIGMVFQNYALFPHLTVSENVAYGLKIKKLPRKEIKERVLESLSLVKLETFADRMPHQLSGGQQQRVAIARALAIQPSVLLLDEPLSNLDAKLRKEMQFELRNIQQRVGITTVLVTHDQEEALSLSDRIGILGEGRIQQIGTPLEVYRQPANRFVAEFIGQVNLFDAVAAANIDEKKELLVYEVPGFETEDHMPLKLMVKNEGLSEKKNTMLLMLRPERVRVSKNKGNEKTGEIQAKLKDISYVGNALRLNVALGKGVITVHCPDPVFPVLPSAGDVLNLHWDPEDLIPLGSKEN